MLNNDSIVLEEETQKAMNGYRKLGDILQTCFNMRREVKRLTDQADQLKKESNVLIESIYETTGVEEYKTNLGTIKKVTKTNTSLDKDLLAMELLKLGLTVIQVADAITGATKKTEVKSWNFFAAKKR